MSREIQMEDFKLALRSIWRSKVIIVFATLAGFFAGLFFTADATIEKLYKAKATVYCVTYGSSAQIQEDVAKMVNYSDIVTSHKVCELAASLIKEANVTAEDIQKMIYIEINNNSYVMSINAMHSDPILVIKVANAVAEAFTSEMSIITDNDSVQILDAAISQQLSGSSRNLTRLYFAAGAFVFICVLIGLRSLLSNKHRLINQCVEDSEILGIVPYIY